MQHFIFIAVVSLFSYAQALCNYTIGEVPDPEDPTQCSFNTAIIDSYLENILVQGYVVDGFIMADSVKYTKAYGKIRWPKTSTCVDDTFSISISDNTNYLLMQDYDSSNDMENRVYSSAYLATLDWEDWELVTAVEDPNCPTAVSNPTCDTITTLSEPALSTVCAGGSYTGDLIAGALTKECAGATCATSDADTCCAAKAKCVTLATSACSGESHTGHRIIAAATTECNGAACTADDADACCAVKEKCSHMDTSACFSGVLIAAHADTDCAGAECAITDADTCCDGEAFFSNRDDFANLLPTFKKLFNAGGGC